MPPVAAVLHLPAPTACRGLCHRRAQQRRPPHHSTASSSVLVSSSASTSLRSSKQQADAMMKVHVAIVCFKYFRCFLRYIASIVYRCCKSISTCYTCCNGYTRMFQVYVLSVSSVLDECCKCFVWILQK
jgi:hypothetical protein